MVPCKLGLNPNFETVWPAWAIFVLGMETNLIDDL